MIKPKHRTNAPARAYDAFSFTDVTYKGYGFEIRFEVLDPPIPGAEDDYRFAAKVVSMRAPKGKKLGAWAGELKELWGYTRNDAEEKVTKAAKKWIDKLASIR